MARRIAILVGNARFHAESELGPLQGPPNDVAALAAVLEDADRGGFEVQRFVDARKDAVLPVIDEVLSTAEADDLVLLFYAGHGKARPQRTALPRDRGTRAAALRSTSIPVSELKELVAQSRAASVVLLLDCCFSGAIGKEFIRGGVDDQLALMKDAQGLHILTAATGLQAARERDADLGRHDDGRVHARHRRRDQQRRRRPRRDGEIKLTDLRRHLQETLRGQTPKYFAHDASGDPRIARAATRDTRAEAVAPPRSVVSTRHDPGAYLPGALGCGVRRGDPKLVALVQRVLDNKEMRARSWSPHGRRRCAAIPTGAEAPAGRRRFVSVPGLLLVRAA